MKLRPLLVFLLLLFFAAVHAAEKPQNLFPPFQTLEEMENVLKEWKVVDSRWLGKGVTRPRKLTLSDGQTQYFAVFKDVEVRKQGITRLAKGVEVDFKDCWQFDVAAYELDKLLGLNMVPVTVERRHDGKKGALQWWVPNAMTEGDRKQKGMDPPDTEEWNRALFKVRVFDNLIYNIDRNLGNLLITNDWTVWMIDHSRCFKTMDELKSPGDMKRFSKSLIESLKGLDERALKECCEDYLSGVEIRALLARRDLILRFYDRLLEEKGGSILYP